MAAPLPRDHVEKTTEKRRRSEIAGRAVATGRRTDRRTKTGSEKG